MHRTWLASGALAGAVAVALAAWLAHGAPARLDAARLGMAQSAATMLGWHALALLATGLWAERRGAERRLPHLAGAAFALGLLLFCGGVLGAVAGVRLGPVAPVGGSLLIGGWLLLLLAALRR
jgi:uncharacterized membrane protein YgdD (TMEM256/DUF423 family)